MSDISEGLTIMGRRAINTVVASFTHPLDITDFDDTGRITGHRRPINEDREAYENLLPLYQRMYLVAKMLFVTHPNKTTFIDFQTGEMNSY